MRNILQKTFLVILVLSALAFLASPAIAQDKSFGEGFAEKTFGPGVEKPDINPFNTDLIGEVRPSLPGEVSSTRSSNPLFLINRIVQILLSFIGIGTIVLMVYAGYMWMTAAGNDERVTKAKRTLRNALIGLILIMMSYSLTIFVARRIQREAGSFGVGNTFRATTGSGFDALPQGSQEGIRDLLE